MPTVDEKVAKLDRDHPTVEQAGAGRLFSIVKRMKAERDLEIPFNRRTTVATGTSVKTKSGPMTAPKWEKSFSLLTKQLKRENSELSSRASAEDDQDELEFRKKHGMSRG